jgi:outer membrane protein assembly factor BamB
MMREHGGSWLAIHNGLVSLVVAAALVVGAGVFPQSVQAQRRPADKAPTVVLVNADDEYASYLSEAVGFLEAGQHDEAIRILQELMRVPNGGFVATDSPGVYRGLRLRAADALTKLDAEGLKRYRMMFDTRARELYNEALAGDVVKLRAVSQMYAQTTYGARAVERLGAVYFDRGQFAQAEGVWRPLLETNLEPADRAVLLARLAAAGHFGVTADRDAWLAELKDNHPDARGEMGGQMQNLVEFVESLRAIDPTTILVRSTREVFAQGWPGVGGVPSGTALMDDSQVLLEPRWAATGKGGDRIDPARLYENLLALKEVLSNPMFSAQGDSNARTSVRMELDRGHVQVRASVSSQPLAPFILPPAVEPVIVGDQVIFRTSESVVAMDIVTGKPIWDTPGPDMKMERPLPIQRNYPGGVFYPDMGRYRITVGTNKIYVVSSFRPYVHPWVFQSLGANADRNQLADTSRLIAIQIDPANPTSGDRQGKRVWRVGMGEGDDDLLRGGKFLSAPTYKDGRLYAVVEFVDAFHLACLDADKGTLVWRSMIAQVPAQMGYGPWGGMQTESTARAAPPAVADGRVYVATNGGVVAAVEADSGLPVWAFQYTQRPVMQRSQMQVMMVPTPALNPLIVAGGRVLALPADSSQLLCLSAETGQPLWPAVSRRELNELSYIDDGRVLLSGEGMLIVDTSNGARSCGPRATRRRAGCRLWADPR